jgi:ubiquitin carboxyl-terminal hydrolase 10
LHGAETTSGESQEQTAETASVIPEQAQAVHEHVEAPAAPAAPAPSEQETPITSEAPSEADSTHPTTPSSVVVQQTTPRQATHTRTATKPVVPLIPIKPVVPNIAAQRKCSAVSASSAAEKEAAPITQPQPDAVQTAETTKAWPSPEATPVSPPKATPTSWAALLRSNKPAAAPVAGAPSGSSTGSVTGKATTLADVIRAYSVDTGSRLTFIEPKGLVNTGNMCYMNSVRIFYPCSLIRWFY